MIIIKIIIKYGVLKEHETHNKNENTDKSKRKKYKVQKKRTLLMSV
jgi:hypothetical protein